MTRVIAIISVLILVFSLPVLAENAPPIDENDQGVESEEVDKEIKARMQAEEEDEENLPTDEADMKEASPSMPEESTKSIFFGDVKLRIDYTSFAMKDFNDLAGLENFSKINSGLELGLDLGIKINDAFSVGSRIGYIMTFPESNKDYTIDLNALPIMGGFSMNLYVLGTPLILSADIFAGYLMANSTLKYTGDAGIEFPQVEYSGSTFMMEYDIDFNFHIFADVSAGFDCGYRHAIVPKMEATKDAGSTKKGSTMQKSADEDLQLDMSGIKAGVNISMNY